LPCADFFLKSLKKLIFQVFFFDSFAHLACTSQLSLAFLNHLPSFGFIDWLELPKIMADKLIYLSFDEILFSCLFYVNIKKYPLSPPPPAFWKSH